MVAFAAAVLVGVVELPSRATGAIGHTGCLGATGSEAYGPSDGVLCQFVAGRRLLVAGARLYPAVSTFSLSGGILPPASGAPASLEVSIIDPIGREGVAAPVATAPMP